MHAHPGKGMKSLQVAARKQGFETGTRDEQPANPCISQKLFHYGMLANYFVRRTIMNF
jgi:hypothetical protein